MRARNNGIRNSSIIFGTILVCILCILTLTVVAYIEDHNKKLIYSTEEQVKYIAKRCYLEGMCKSIMTLDDLYKNGYAREIIHPITKEVVDSNKTIYINDNSISFSLD